MKENAYPIQNILLISKDTFLTTKPCVHTKTHIFFSTFGFQLFTNSRK